MDAWRRADARGREHNSNTWWHKKTKTEAVNWTILTEQHAGWLLRWDEYNADQDTRVGQKSHPLTRPKSGGYAEPIHYAFLKSERSEKLTLWRYEKVSKSWHFEEYEWTIFVVKKSRDWTIVSVWKEWCATIMGGEECATWRGQKDGQQKDRLCLQLAFYRTLVTNTNNIALRAFNQWNRQMNVLTSEWINKWMIVSMSMWNRGEYLFVCKWKYRPPPQRWENGRIHELGAPWNEVHCMWRIVKYDTLCVVVSM